MPGELRRILIECERAPTYLRPIVLLAVETAMRRGELLSLTWSNLDLDEQLAYLPETKNGEKRTVPLSPVAQDILNSLPRSAQKVFPTSANAVRLAWERVKRRARIADLRFHDLRHEAISRLFEAGLSLPEVALISGHKDPRMLLRYTHLTAKSVVKRLTKRSSENDHAQ